MRALREPSLRLILTLFCAALIVLSNGQLASSQTADGQTPKRAACLAPEYHQFDFWIGDWDTFELNDRDKVVARNRVDSILDGCVLREVYEQGDGLTGQSFTIYDAARKVWHQSWVTNRGQLLVLEGGMQSDRMVLSGTDRTADGKSIQLRGVWTRVEGGVRETAETSADGGKTWKPLFDIVFRPHKPQAKHPRRFRLRNSISSN